MINIGSRKQLFIDDRFFADQHDVTLVVNPPVKTGLITVAASTAPSIVEHGGVCYLYQGLNGATSVWTSADGLDWTPRGQLTGVDDAAGVLTGINSVCIDPTDADFPFKGLYECMRPRHQNSTASPASSARWG
jgi:hypothetical protein